MRWLLAAVLAAGLTAGCAQTTTLHDNALSAPCVTVSTPDLPPMTEKAGPTPAENAPKLELRVRVFAANEMFERDIGFAVTPGRGAFVEGDMVTRMVEAAAASPNVTLLSTPLCTTPSGLPQRIDLFNRVSYVAGYTRGEGGLKPVTSECDKQRLAACATPTLKGNVVQLSDMAAVYSLVDMVECSAKFRWRESPGGAARHGTLEWAEPIQRVYLLVLLDGVALRPGMAYLAEMTGHVKQGCSNLRLASPRDVRETHAADSPVGDKTRVLSMWEVRLAEEAK